MWRNPEVETVRVWQKLSQSWGVPITTVDNADSQATSLDTDTDSGLMAHSGILDMAQELYMEMRPIFQEHSGALPVDHLYLHWELSICDDASFRFPLS